MLVVTAILGGGGVDPSHFPCCIAMSHSLTLLAHCQGLVSQIRQTLLTAQQIARLGGTEQWETLFGGETNMQNNVSRGYISYNEK